MITYKSVSIRWIYFQITNIKEENIMGLFSKLFKGPQIDMEKSNANAKKMRALFNHVVENGDGYRLIFG